MRARTLVIMAAILASQVCALYAAPTLPTPGHPLAVAIDQTAMVILSDARVLAQMNAAVTRYGGVLSGIEVTDIRPGGSTYRLNFVHATPPPAGIPAAVGFFTVEVGFGAMMKPHVSAVANLTLTR